MMLCLSNCIMAGYKAKVVVPDSVVFYAGGRYSTDIAPPVFACKKCGRVFQPKRGQTQFFCHCGNYAQLMAEGRPVLAVPK